MNRRVLALLMVFLIIFSNPLMINIQSISSAETSEIYPERIILRERSSQTGTLYYAIFPADTSAKPSKEEVYNAGTTPIEGQLKIGTSSVIKYDGTAESEILADITFTLAEQGGSMGDYLIYASFLKENGRLDNRFRTFNVSTGYGSVAPVIDSSVSTQNIPGYSSVQVSKNSIVDSVVPNVTFKITSDGSLFLVHADKGALDTSTFATQVSSYQSTNEASSYVAATADSSTNIPVTNLKPGLYNIYAKNAAEELTLAPLANVVYIYDGTLTPAVDTSATPQLVKGATTYIDVYFNTVIDATNIIYGNQLFDTFTYDGSVLPYTDSDQLTWTHDYSTHYSKVRVNINSANLEGGKTVAYQIKSDVTAIGGQTFSTTSHTMTVEPSKPSIPSNVITLEGTAVDVQITNTSSFQGTIHLINSSETISTTSDIPKQKTLVNSSDTVAANGTATITTDGLAIGTYYAYFDPDYGEDTDLISDQSVNSVSINTINVSAPTMSESVSVIYGSSTDVSITNTGNVSGTIYLINSSVTVNSTSDIPTETTLVNSSSISTGGTTSVSTEGLATGTYYAYFDPDYSADTALISAMSATTVTIYAGNAPAPTISESINVLYGISENVSITNTGNTAGTIHLINGAVTVNTTSDIPSDSSLVKSSGTVAIDGAVTLTTEGLTSGTYYAYFDPDYSADTALISVKSTNAVTIYVPSITQPTLASSVSVLYGDSENVVITNTSSIAGTVYLINSTVTVSSTSNIPTDSSLMKSGSISASGTATLSTSGLAAGTYYAYFDPDYAADTALISAQSSNTVTIYTANANAPTIAQNLNVLYGTSSDVTITNTGNTAGTIHLINNSIVVTSAANIPSDATLAKSSETVASGGTATLSTNGLAAGTYYAYFDPDYSMDTSMISAKSANYVTVYVPNITKPTLASSVNVLYGVSENIVLTNTSAIDGTMYLINSTQTVNSTSDIPTDATLMKSGGVLAEGTVTLSTSGLSAGTYYAYFDPSYSADTALVSDMSTNTVIIYVATATAPTIAENMNLLYGTTTDIAITNTANIAGTVHLVNSSVAVNSASDVSTDQTLAKSSGTVAIGGTATLSTSGLAAGTYYAYFDPDYEADTALISARSANGITIYVPNITKPTIASTVNVLNGTTANITITNTSNIAGTMYLISNTVTVSNASDIPTNASLMKSSSVSSEGTVALSTSGLAVGTYYGYFDPDYAADTAIVSDSSTNSVVIYVATATAPTISESATILFGTAADVTITNTANVQGNVYLINGSVTVNQASDIPTDSTLVRSSNTIAIGDSVTFSIEGLAAGTYYAYFNPDYEADSTLVSAKSENAITIYEPTVTAPTIVSNISELYGRTTYIVITNTGNITGKIHLISSSVAVNSAADIPTDSSIVKSSDTVAVGGTATLSTEGLAAGTYYAYFDPDYSADTSLVSAKSANTVSIYSATATAPTTNTSISVLHGVSQDVTFTNTGNTTGKIYLIDGAITVNSISDIPSDTTKMKVSTTVAIGGTATLSTDGLAAGTYYGYFDPDYEADGTLISGRSTNSVTIYAPSVTQPTIAENLSVLYGTSTDVVITNTTNVSGKIYLINGSVVVNSTSNIPTDTTLVKSSGTVAVGSTATLSTSGLAAGTYYAYFNPDYSADTALISAKSVNYVTVYVPTINRPTIASDVSVLNGTTENITIANASNIAGTIYLINSSTSISTISDIPSDTTLVKSGTLSANGTAVLSTDGLVVGTYYAYFDPDYSADTSLISAKSINGVTIYVATATPPTIAESQNVLYGTVTDIAITNSANIQGKVYLINSSISVNAVSDIPTDPTKVKTNGTVAIGGTTTLSTEGLAPGMYFAYFDPDYEADATLISTYSANFVNLYTANALTPTISENINTLYGTAAEVTITNNANTPGKIHLVNSTITVNSASDIPTDSTKVKSSGTLVVNDATILSTEGLVAGTYYAYFDPEYPADTTLISPKSSNSVVIYVAAASAPTMAESQTVLYGTATDVTITNTANIAGKVYLINGSETINTIADIPVDTTRAKASDTVAIGGTATLSTSGLAAGTYYAYFDPDYSMDTSLVSAKSVNTITIYEPTVTAPTIISSVSELYGKATYILIENTANITGTIHLINSSVEVNGASSIPTDSTKVKSSGTVAVGGSVTLSVEGLVAGTYYAYFDPDYTADTSLVSAKSTNKVSIYAATATAPTIETSMNVLYGTSQDVTITNTGNTTGKVYLISSSVEVNTTSDVPVDTSKVKSSGTVAIGGTGTVSVDGLAAGTYYAYFDPDYVADTTLISGRSVNEVTIYVPTITKPTLATNVSVLYGTTTDIVITNTSNIEGKIHLVKSSVIVTSPSDIPTDTTIAKSSGTVANNGSVTLSTEGLAAGTYFAYFDPDYAADTGLISTKSTNAVTINAPSATAPTISVNTTVLHGASVDVIITNTANVQGTIYLVNNSITVDKVADIPTDATKVKSSGVVSVGGSATLSTDGLAVGTYYAYFDPDYSADTTLISSKSINTVTVYVPAATAPTMASSVSILNGTAADIVITNKANIAGKVYLIDSSVTISSIADIPQDAKLAKASGTVEANGTTTVTIEGLSPGTFYAYFDPDYAADTALISSRSVNEVVIYVPSIVQPIMPSDVSVLYGVTKDVVITNTSNIEGTIHLIKSTVEVSSVADVPTDSAIAKSSGIVSINGSATLSTEGLAAGTYNIYFDPEYSADTALISSKGANVVIVNAPSATVPTITSDESVLYGVAKDIAITNTANLQGKIYLVSDSITVATVADIPTDPTKVKSADTVAVGGTATISTDGLAVGTYYAYFDPDYSADTTLISSKSINKVTIYVPAATAPTIASSVNILNGTAADITIVNTANISGKIYLVDGAVTVNGTTDIPEDAKQVKASGSVDAFGSVTLSIEGLSPSEYFAYFDPDYAADAALLSAKSDNSVTIYVPTVNAPMIAADVNLTYGSTSGVVIGNISNIDGTIHLISNSITVSSASDIPTNPALVKSSSTVAVNGIAILSTDGLQAGIYYAYFDPEYPGDTAFVSSKSEHYVSISVPIVYDDDDEDTTSTPDIVAILEETPVVVENLNMISDIITDSFEEIAFAEEVDVDIEVVADNMDVMSETLLTIEDEDVEESLDVVEKTFNSLSEQVGTMEEEDKEILTTNMTNLVETAGLVLERAATTSDKVEIAEQIIDNFTEVIPEVNEISNDVSGVAILGDFNRQVVDFANKAIEEESKFIVEDADDTVLTPDQFLESITKAEVAFGQLEQKLDTVGIDNSTKVVKKTVLVDAKAVVNSEGAQQIGLTQESIQLLSENVDSVKIDFGTTMVELDQENMVDVTTNLIFKIDKGTQSNEQVDSESTETENVHVKVFEAYLETTPIERFDRPVRVSFDVSEFGFEDATASELNQLRVLVQDEETGEWESVGGNYDPKSGLMIIYRIHMSKYTMVKNKKSYSDVGNSWAKDEINNLLGKGIANASKEFKPSDTITREEFAVWISRAYGLKAEGVEEDFKDIDENNPYFAEISMAFEQGLVQGTGDGDFNPDEDITREEMATLIARAISNYNDIKVPDATGQRFALLKDGAETSEWAVENVALMIDTGIMTTDGDGNFNPNEPISKEAAAAIFDRLYK